MRRASDGPRRPTLGACLSTAASGVRLPHLPDPRELVERGVERAAGEHAGRADHAAQGDRLVGRQLLHGVVGAEVVRDRVEAAAVDDARAGFARTVVILQPHAVDELRLAGQVDVVGAGARTGGDQRLPELLVGTHGRDDDPGPGGDRGQRHRAIHFHDPKLAAIGPDELVKSTAEDVLTIIKKDKDSAGDLAFTSSGGGGFSGQTLKFHEPKPRDITEDDWVVRNGAVIATLGRNTSAALVAIAAWALMVERLVAGLRDAANLAWKLAWVVKDQAAPGILAAALLVAGAGVVLTSRADADARRGRRVASQARLPSTWTSTPPLLPGWHRWPAAPRTASCRPPPPSASTSIRSSIACAGTLTFVPHSFSCKPPA